MKINFVGAVRDSSGYAEFARSFVAALHDIGADLAVEPLSFEPSHSNHGRYGEICNKLTAYRHNKIDVNVINMIPKVYDNFRKPNAMNIGFTMFETNRVPKIWAQQCNTMDAILVPCQWNKEVFINSGVTVPVEVCPPGVDASLYPIKKQLTGNQKKYKFYSIFQWSERKNPYGLIKAFMAAFSGNSDVSLTLKTYVKDYSKKEQEFLVNEITSMKKTVTLPHSPFIFLRHEKLSTQQMQEFHLSHDCFVLPTRAEGFGLPYIEAMMMGNPAIGTRYSGNLEFMTDQNSYLLDAQLTPVANMGHIGPWYDGSMLWAEPDLSQLIEYMQNVYANQDDARNKAVAARDSLLSNIGWEKQAQHFLNTIERLYADWQSRRAGG